MFNVFIICLDIFFGVIYIVFVLEYEFIEKIIILE